MIFEPTISIESEEFVTEWYNIKEECGRKPLTITVNFCMTITDGAKNELREIDSNLKSTQSKLEYKTNNFK